MAPSITWLLVRISPDEVRTIPVPAARALWKGAWTASYVARATTPGSFVRPPVHAEELYNPAVYGRSDGGVFTVKARVR